jgi:hypothetical protein
VPLSKVAKVQHYVPQFLLRQFGHGKKDRVHVFDKQTSRSFATNAKNVASESAFYNFRVGQHKATLEPGLANLESQTKPLIQRMLDQDSASVFSAKEKALLCAFLAVQFTRTRAFREQWRSLPEMLGERLRAMSTSPEQLASVEEYIRLPDENQTKVEMARIMMKAPSDFGPHFANKRWLLIATTRDRPFLICDNPLALQNSIDMKPYGNLGLAVRGIEIYLPLSPTRALAMWCPSIEATIREGAETIAELRKTAPHIIEISIPDPKAIENLASALVSGAPLLYTADNVLNFNSLQVSHAERYVFSSNQDFSLAQRMIAEQPKFKTGRRMKMD